MPLSNTTTQIAEIDNSILMNTSNISDTDIEDFICLNLTKAITPNDLTNNFTPDPNSVSIYADNHISGPNLINKTLFLNNESLINNELFGMKIDFVNTPNTHIFDAYYGYYGKIGSMSNPLELNSSTTSIFDSNLKMDISFNNGAQYTDILSDNSGEWNVTGDRSLNSNKFNTFSALNSLYNRNDDYSPFYIEESSYNVHSLGNDSNTYFTILNNNVGDGVLIPHNINSSNTLISNNIISNIVTSSTSHDFTDFNSYKLVQDRPTILSEINLTGQSPVKYVSNGSTFEISSNIFDFSGAFQDLSNVASGFKLKLDISAGGGYSIVSNDLFTLDNSELTNNANNPYMGLNNLEELNHKFVVTNGTTTLSESPSSNASLIYISNDAETLDSSFNNKNGLITLKVDSSDNRVYYPFGSGSNVTDNYGNKCDLTNKVIVSYPEEAITSIADFGDVNLLTEENVECYIEIQAPSTVYSNPVDISNFLYSDNRNIAFNNNTILTVVRPTPFSGNYIPPKKNDFSFNSMFSAVDTSNQINIISIDNKFILTQDSPIKDSNNNPVEGTASTVIVRNTDLSNSLYSRLNVHLDTKRIKELSSSLNLTSGWNLTDLSGNYDGYLIGDAKKRGLPNDDHLFMTTNPEKILDVSYEFVITNKQSITNIKAITRAIKISYYDLYYDSFTDNDLSYNTLPTVTYIYDYDNDIQFTDISNVTTKLTIEDISNLIHSNIDISNTSITSLENIMALPFPDINKSDYRFEIYKQVRTYTASFYPKIQFYTNIKMQTPPITETVFYYKLINNSTGADQSYLLKNFINNHTQNNLSNIAVKISTASGDSMATSMVYSNPNCSIFKASIWGLDNTNTYTKISDYFDIDPFFNQNQIIPQFSNNNGTAGALLTIQFTDIQVTDSSYTIDLTNKSAVNSLSITAKKYIYKTPNNTTPGSPDELDDYTPYNNFYDLSSNMTKLMVDISNIGNGSISVTIRENSTVLAMITTPSTLINTYNIISIPAPFAQVDYTIGNNSICSSTRVLAYNNHINILPGIDYYLNPQNATINSLGIGANESFKLVTDSFKILYVDDPSYTSLYNPHYSVMTKFSSLNIQTFLDCTATTNNYARSIEFTQLRGYPRNPSLNGEESITINRTVTTGVFNLYLPNDDNIATQNITNIYNGASMNLTNVVYDGTTYSLGLILNFDKSMLTSDIDTKTYPFGVKVAKYSVNVIANPHVPSIVQNINSGYLLENQNLLSPYFNNVKPATIKVDNPYSLTVTYTVPNIKLHKSSSYIGDPTDISTSWTFKTEYSHNDLLNTINIIPQYQLQRTTNVFYNKYNAFFVIAPPVVSVYGVTDINYSGSLSNINTLTPSYITSFHINHNSNSYTISPSFLNNNQNIIFKEVTPFTKSYYDYITIKGNKHFRIEGNYVTVRMYINGISTPYSTSPDDPASVDRFDRNIVNTLIENTVMTQLHQIYDNSAVNVTFNQVTKTNDIQYNQFIPLVNTYHNTPNVIFSIGNPFTPPSSTSDHMYYFRLFTNTGSKVAFYQSNLIFNDGIYYINIDKFDTGNLVDYNRLIDASNIDYNALLRNDSVNELLFPIYKHSYKQILVDEIIDSNGNVKSIDTILNSITNKSITESSWTQDNDFNYQYLGITLAAISGQGLINIQKLFKFNAFDFVSSKSLYVYLPDMMKVINNLGNTVYRVTNGGNVHAPRVTTSHLSLFTSITDPIKNTIPGAGDIQSIYNQNSLLQDRFGNMYNNL
jgi:hypothetical protein